MVKMIYLAGAYTGCVEYAKKWRHEVSEWIRNISERCVRCFDPTEHFSFEDVEMGETTDREAMDYDLFMLRNSDLVILNFGGNLLSLGTMAELGIAYDRRIPVIGLNEDNAELHPWQRDMCQKVFTNKEDMLSYIAYNYL